MIPLWRLRFLGLSQALTCAPLMFSRPPSAATSSPLTFLSLHLTGIHTYTVMVLQMGRHHAQLNRMSRTER